VGRHPR
jgi:hypothetical protein